MKIDIQRALEAGFTIEDLYTKGLEKGMSGEDLRDQLNPYFKKRAQQKMMDNMPTYQKFFAGMGKAVVDTGRGIGQLFGLVSDEDIRESRELDAPLMEDTAGVVGNITGHMATALTPGLALKGLGAAKAGQALLAPQTFKTAAGIGAVQSGIQPAEDPTERALNTLLGAGSAGLGQGIGRYLGGGVGTTAGRTAKATEKAAKKLGIQTTPGQSTRNATLMQLEEGMKSYPPTASLIHNVSDANQEVFNKVAAKAIGQNADELSEDVIYKALGDISEKFAPLEKVKFIPLDDEFGDRLADLTENYVKVIGGKGSTRSSKLIADAMEKYNEGSMSGAWLKRSRTALGRELVTAGKQGDQSAKEVAGGLIDALDDAAEKFLPVDMTAGFKEGRQQWRNWLAISKSFRQPGSPDISMPKLATNLQKAYKTDYLTGKAPDKATKDLFDVTKFTNTHRGIVGDSGTATRMALPYTVGSMIGGGGLGYGLSGGDPTMAAAGAVALPLAARGLGGAYMNKYLQPILSQGGLSGLGYRGADPLMKGFGTYLGGAFAAQE